MDSFLNCFYDFSVCPAYYDFLTFLQIAELHRLRHGFSKIRVLFVKGPNSGFRQDKLRTPESNQLMFRNVLLPSCHLLESLAEILWVSSRADCVYFLKDSQSIFPRGYCLHTPVSDYLEGALQCAFLRGESISYFRAPAEKRSAARSFLSTVSGGKKVVTLTLREAAHDSTDRRNLDEVTWTQFLQSSEASGYQPVIIRDTCKMFSPDSVFPMFPQAPLASADVLFRTALYEAAHLNIFPNNGPYTCALYSQSASLAFKYQDDRVVATSAKWFEDILGLAFGDQRPISEKRSVIVWEDDSIDIISRAVAAMNFQINQFAGLSEKHGISSAAQAQRTVTVALKYTLTKLSIKAALEDLVALTQIQSICEIFDIQFGSGEGLRELLLKGEGVFFPEGTIKILREFEKQFPTGLRL